MKVFESLLALLFILGGNTIVYSQGFSKTSDGLEYKYWQKSDSGEVVGIGGYLEAHIVVKTRVKGAKKDTVLSNSYTSGYGVSKMLVAAPTYKGCINGGFAMLKTGDSITFKVLADSIYGNTFKQPLPPFLTGKEKIEVTVKALVSQTEETFNTKLKQAKESEAKKKSDLLKQETKELRKEAARLGYKDKLIEDPSGVLYVKLKETDNAVAKEGERGDFFYRGTFIGGNIFDTNFGGTPFGVTIGKGGAIQGWLAVVGKMKLGERWLVFIPSSLAYAEKGVGKIPANTPLVFEMELSAINSAEEIAKQKAEKDEKGKAKELAEIKAYISNKNYNQVKGHDIYYNVTKIGDGLKPIYGDSVAIKISSSDLKGNTIKQFTITDSPTKVILNEKSIPLGIAAVLEKLKLGGKAKVVSKSLYFQGEEGSGVVPAFTPIYFEVELVEVIKKQ